MTEELHMLRELLEDHARIRAEPGKTIKLASGQSTTFYFDAKPVIQSPEGMRLIGKLVWEKAQELRAEAVGGLATGCIPIADAAVAHGAFNDDRRLRGFYVRERKDHGVGETIYQSFATDGQKLITTGRRVLIVDDVITTGGSIQKAISEIEAKGAKVAGIYVIIDREAPEADRPDGIKQRYEVHSMFKSDAAGNLIENDSRQMAIVG
jgi:orotate phosphoribosyltransferase